MPVQEADVMPAHQADTYPTPPDTTQPIEPERPAMPVHEADAYPIPPDSSQPIEPERPSMPVQEADAMPAQLPDAYPTPPDSSQPIERERPLNTHYYLTEGLEGVEHLEYRDIRSFKGAVDSRAYALSSGKADEYLPPYLILSPVTPHQLVNIDRARKNRYKGLRFLYLKEPKTLIVKYMSGPIHEMVSDVFAQTIWTKIFLGGQKAEITTMRSTTYQGKQSCKEADGSFRPLGARPDHSDWPTIVLECGVTETPRRLKVDARWWIENSDGAVKLVLLFFLSVAAKTIRIELWKQDTTENPQQTRGNDKDEVTGPTLKRVINITPEVVTGAPLQLRFKEIFLRKPNPERGEQNYMITEIDFREYYNHVWPPAPGAGSGEEYYTGAVSESSSSSEGYIVE